MDERTQETLAATLDGEEVREVLGRTFFAAEREIAPRAAARAPSRAAERPEHYKVICISFYNEDLSRLDETVRELKRRGFTKANRSAVLRVALAQLDLDRVPRGL